MAGRDASVNSVQHWVSEKIHECCVCCDCGEKVSPLDEVCKNCGRGGPARVSSGGAVLFVGVSSALVALIAAMIV